MTTRVEMIIETLKKNKDKKFTARELAEEFLKNYPKEMQEKQKNPNYATKEKLIAQLAAEIGGIRTVAAKKNVPISPQKITLALGFTFGKTISTQK